MKKITLLLTVIVATLLSSCGDSSKFSAKGMIEDVGSQNMRVIYYANDAVQVLNVPVEFGRFSFETEIKSPTLLEFYTANKALLARAYIDGDERIECKFYNGIPYKAEIKGSDISERWTTFLNENSETISNGNVEEINALVAKYINSNKDDILSTLLLLTEYTTIGNEEAAASLLASINAEARPISLTKQYEILLDRTNNVKSRELLYNTSFYDKNDSISIFAPHKSSYSLLVFSNEKTRKSNNIAKELRNMRNDFHEKRLQIVDISLDTDTAIWKKAIKTDSATWTQGWVIGSVSALSIERLGISRLPFYIVADSSGTQLYHGLSINDAEKAITQHLNPIEKK